MRRHDGVFRLASHLQMSLSECVAKHTYREYLLWLDWLDKQYNEPSRTDYYLMQIAMYVASKFSKKTWKLKDFEIPFQVKTEMTEEEKQQRALQSKSAWGMILGASKASTNVRKGWPGGSKS